MDKKSYILATLVKMSAYYRASVTDEVLEMYADDLMDIDPEKLKIAFLSIRRNPKIKFMPLPAEIREICCPVITNQNIAVDSVGKIIQAIADFGWCNENKAREFIGDIGQYLVERNGGWKKVCEMKHDEIPFFRSQAIKLAESYCIQNGIAFKAIESSGDFDKLEYHDGN